MTVNDLKASFGDCCMLMTTCLYPTSYEVHNVPVLFIRDQAPQKPVIVCSENDHELKVIREDQEPITLVKMDSCLIPHAVSKCDCLIFNNKKLFLVELKTSCVKQRSTARKEAAEQLTNTLDLLRAGGVVISQDDIQAIICFKTEKTYPVMASRSSMRAYIYEQYRVWLNEGNEIYL